MLLSRFRHSITPQYLAVLSEVPLFSGLNRHELDTLNNLLHQRTYVRDEIIFDQDEEGQAIYFILSGKVRVSVEGQILSTLEAGQFFGERALLENVPRSSQVRALENCVIAVLFREDFLHLLHTYPQIASTITQHCSLRRTQYPEAEDKVAAPPLLANVNSGPGPVAWAGIIASTCLLLLIFKKILWLVVPFLLALILYYLLAPLEKKLVLAGTSRHLAAIILSGAFLVFTILVLLLVYPLVVSNAASWQAGFIHYSSGGASLAEQVLGSLQEQFSFLQSAHFGSNIYQRFTDFSEHFSDKYLGKVLTALATWLPSLLLTPIITFFMLKDGAHLRKMLGAAVPNAFFEKTLYLIHAVDQTARLYFVGLMKITLIDTILTTLGLWALGISSPLILGLIVAVLCWIPYLGPLLGFAIVALVASTDMPGNIGVIYSLAALFILIRMLDDFFFLPAIVGRSLRIHPLLTIMMFLIGEAIAGVAGLMLVIPILGVIRILGETMEIILKDTRLQARHRYSEKLRWRAATRDLER
ncbi:AI-2E family transporter [Methylobacillus caricis]|uniref:AI-2E family transporter n=1 Tax=Methylobacillus caricis TaxID=1971611 RepID=UPI001CFFE42C|nr:AI-2E family transporter [Methylobacillus caricis]MCB5188504.1 AI-2E family transporter [Methylobacillus caricis]